MRQVHPFTLLTAIQMPLRDAMRGVSTLADATEEMLEPAANLLPPPVRARFRSALNAVEDAGKRLIQAPVTLEHITTASDVLMGKSGDLERAAGVIAYAWEHLRHSGLSHRLMISETILAGRLAGLRPVPGETPAQRAAGLIADLRGSSAVGWMPGVSADRGPDEQIQIDMTLVATSVWLLAARAGSLPEEEKLLDLASALTLAMRKDIVEARDAPDHLARVLQTMAVHL